MKKISIIVPVYNVEKYLRKCLDSIVDQTYENLEIILIDDGSTDNSGFICDEYANKDKRIKAVHKENEGVSKTKNLGVKLSTSDYISFIDSDDYVTPDYCELLYNNLIETNSDVSIVGYNVVREDGTVIESAIKDNGLDDNEIVVYKDQDIIKELLLQNTIKNFVCKLYKKSVLCDFPVGVTYEDIVFSFNVLNNANSVVYMNKRCYNYLKRSGSITATISEKNLLDFGNAIYDRYKIVKEDYPDLIKYNIYAFLESTVALSIKSIICNNKYSNIENKIEEYLNIIIDYSKLNENDLLPLLNDYQKLCLYLMKYNKNLYFTFLTERQKLKIAGIIN